MTEKDKPLDNFGRAVPSSDGQVKPDILRIKDIIPGTRQEGANEGAHQVDIPRFDLAEDIMAEQRRLTAIRRKGPLTDDRSPGFASLHSPRFAGEAGQDEQRTENRNPSSVISSQATAQSYISLWDPIIADIVAKDIERLCSGARV
jgi:hypothetical protein